MREAGGDRCRAAQFTHRHRHAGIRAVSAESIAELAEFIIAPAPCCAVREQGASVILIGGEGRCPWAGGEQPNPANLYRRVGIRAVSAESIAELAELVTAPAPRCAVREQGAAMIAAGGEGRCPRAGGGQPNPADPYRRAGNTAGGSVSKLAELVSPPALNRAVRKQSAGVIRTGGDGRCPRASGGQSNSADPYRRAGNTAGGSVSKLAVIIEAPALYCAIGNQGAGVHPADGDGCRSIQPRHGYRRAGTRGGSVSKLAELVTAPALYRAIGHQGALGESTCGDCGGTVRRQRETAGYHYGRAGIRCCPVTQLARCVKAPALHRAIGKQGAGVKPAAGGRYRSQPSHRHGDAGIGQRDGILGQLAIVVAAPALRCAIRQHGAGVVEASRDGRCGSTESSYRHRAARIVRSSVAELAIGIVSPALCRAIGKQGAGVFKPSGDGHCAAQFAHCYRGAGTVRRSPAAKLTIIVIAPALYRAIGKRRARVIFPRGDVCCAAQSTYGYRRAGIRAVAAGSIAKLAGEVIAPALCRAIGHQSASVTVTRGDGRYSAQQTDPPRLEHGHRRAGINDTSVAKLAVDVKAPAFYGAIGKQGAGVIVATGDGRCATEPLHRYG